MPISRDLIRQIRRLDAYDLRRLLMLVRGLLITNGDDVSSPGHRRPHVTFREQMVRCGKPGCSRCPHGPYWYAYWREDGRMRSRYVGKREPGAGPVEGKG